MPCLVIWAAMVLAVTAHPTMLDPSDMVFLLDEDDFEDYLDTWLVNEEQSWVNITLAEQERNAGGCIFRIKGDLGQPQPVYIHKSKLLMPAGNSGQIQVNTGQQIGVGCTGRYIRHPNITTTTNYATATCVRDNIVSGNGWLQGQTTFDELTCSGDVYFEAQATGGLCSGLNIVIRAGYIVDNVFHTWYRSCFNTIRLEVLYVWYEQTAQHSIHEANVVRPGWLAGSFFPGVNINNVYTQKSQKSVIAEIVGDEMAKTYITTRQYLVRGHLSAKVDFPFATAQRSTFYFINAAPQWSPFNGGNWNSLEQYLRKRIAEAGYNTVIYTGTFGVTQLRDDRNRLRDIYLHKTGIIRQVPVPMYFYKVAYDESRRLGTAFISINNPYYSAAELRALQFCTDRCRNNSAFSWLRWQPDRVDLGYSFCCTIADFRKKISHIPKWNVNGLLT